MANVLNRKSFIRLFLSALIFFQFGCSSLSTVDRTKPKPKVTTTQSGFDADTAQEDVPAAPVRKQKPKIALVLGPGGFKTFAYPSFIKSLVQAGVTPDIVVGIEWGALAGSFYAINGKSHEAEWKLYKLEESIVQPSGFFTKGKAVKVDQMRQFLKENLDTKLDDQTQIPFRCPLIKLNSNSLNWATRSPLWQRVENCLASPPQFEPVGAEVPSVLSMHEIAQNLRREGYDILVLVNVLGTSAKDFGKMNSWFELAYWTEVRRQLWSNRDSFTEVVNIDTSAAALFDFSAKIKLQSVGDKAGREAAKSIVDKYQL